MMDMNGARRQHWTDVEKIIISRGSVEKIRFDLIQQTQKKKCHFIVL